MGLCYEIMIHEGLDWTCADWECSFAGNDTLNCPSTVEGLAACADLAGRSEEEPESYCAFEAVGFGKDYSSF